MVESESGVTVAIDSELDEELIGEGLAREFVNRVQNIRKSSGLDVTDRINVNFITDKKLEEYILIFKEYIQNEVLADTISNENTENGLSENLSIGEYNCEITIKKVI